MDKIAEGATQKATKARLYAQYRWKIYAKIGVYVWAKHAFAGLSEILLHQPHCAEGAKELRLRADNISRAIDDLEIELKNHLSELHESGAWRTLVHD